ncbi:CP2 transcription factor-domain-containing protein, partial [Umbelopsis sp. PMI_123]
KGQFYPVSISDTLCRDCDFKTTISIAFHEHPHRQIASNFWKYWICQQGETQAARALDIVTFTWNGRQGAKVLIKFNCLSTDFSRIKGVKGIPLRIAAETHVIDNEHQIEKAFCKIKLFRDKGAERKNKDDAKHIERQLEKLRNKGGDSNPLWLVYMPSQTYTMFSETPSSPEIMPSPLEEPEFEIPLMDTQCSLESLPQEDPNPWCLQQPTAPTAPSSAELKRRFDEYINPDFSNALDIDKSYVPQPRKRKAGR